MGNTKSFTNFTENFKPTISEKPVYYYLNRVDNSIFEVHCDSIIRHSLSHFCIYKDCAIGYLPKDHIVLVGGIKPSGNLSKKVFYLNTKKKEINRLASLKIPTKEGSLLFVSSKLYYFSSNLMNPHQVYHRNA